jgi:2-polyprenyl-3-methyl-5-hydroxy-6-metoxy-1,4-benzoquinol methylase
MKKLLLISVTFLTFLSYAKSPISSTRLNKLSGETSTPFDNKTLWDKRYSKRSYVYGKSPAKFLAENFDYLKAESRVLDMGMGEGRNAVFLAQKGHKVTGIDISSVAIKKSQKLAKELGVKIKTVVGTLNKYRIKEQSFDVIICFYYVDRKLNEKIRKWLKPGGILIYEAHTLNEYTSKGAKGDNKNYYLKPQELLSMFPDMTTLKYEEPLHDSEYRAGIILKKKE